MSGAALVVLAAGGASVVVGVRVSLTGSSFRPGSSVVAPPGRRRRYRCRVGARPQGGVPAAVCASFREGHAPGMAAPELVDLGDPSGITDDGLSRALTVLLAEQRRRAVERCEPNALVEEAFASGFLPSGMPRDPWVRAGVLVCPGAKLDRSAMSHKCAFVRVDSCWVWEHDDLLEDVVRHLPGAQSRMQSVSLVPVGEQAAVDLIEARTRNGVHELVGIRSFTVSEGGLTLVSQRSVGKVSHR